MSEVLKICGIAIITVALTVFLKGHGSAIAQYLPQISAVIIFIGAIGAIVPIISFIKEIASGGNSKNGVSVTTLFLAAAISVICKIVCDLCKENGCEMLKNAVEFATNVEILLLCIPVIRELLTLSSEAMSL